MRRLSFSFVASTLTLLEGTAGEIGEFCVFCNSSGLPPMASDEVADPVSGTDALFFSFGRIVDYQ